MEIKITTDGEHLAELVKFIASEENHYVGLYVDEVKHQSLANRGIKLSFSKKDFQEMQKSQKLPRDITFDYYRPIKIVATDGQTDHAGKTLFNLTLEVLEIFRQTATPKKVIDTVWKILGTFPESN